MQANGRTETSKASAARIVTNSPWNRKKLSGWSESRSRSMGNSRDEMGNMSRNKSQGKDSKNGNNGGSTNCAVSGKETRNGIEGKKFKEKNDRAVFNDSEVREFLGFQFKEASKGSHVLKFDQSLDWNASQSKGWRSKKKYGTLLELERALK